MNIHFEKDDLCHQLLNNTIFKQEVGSPIYGLKTDNSDDDILHVYVESENNLKSFLWEHHQLQYNESDRDLLFTSVQTFIRNIITGDSTINFELLFSDKLRESELNFIYERRFEFITYNVIKSYLGLAKRDIKYLKKDKRKLAHVIRGVEFAKRLYNNPQHFTNDLSNYHNIFGNIQEICLEIKNGTYDRYNEILDHYKHLIQDYRNGLNIKLENGEIKKTVDYKILIEIDFYIKQFSPATTIDYGDMFYKVLQKDIRY